MHGNGLEHLRPHAERLSGQTLKALASVRADRPISACGWTMDTSRHYLDETAEDVLLDYGARVGLGAAVKRLFVGDIVNISENRAALHWALRQSEPLKGAFGDVQTSLEPALDYAEKVRRGEIKTPSGKPFTSIVHIGIGGSDFGPRLISDAFLDVSPPGLKIRFAANVDPRDLEHALLGLDPETTLIIGVSKSFGSEETLFNLGRALTWLDTAAGARVDGQVALVTANRARASAWLDGREGVIFDMPENVGGRYSLWSAASLGCMILLGADWFTAFLRGAERMDNHVREAEPGDNLPMLLSLLDYWNASVRGEGMRVALAYSNRLRLLPTYLQQLEMESNGKTVSEQGIRLDYPTAPAVWGGEGSIGQHSYHQWLHQSAHSAPTEFIIALDKAAKGEGQTALVAHALAQAEVLANGRSLDQVKAEEPGLPDELAAQKVHPGGRPSTVLSCNDFNAEAFGSLIALYEHRTYLAGVLWGVNPFDQWGVERGKMMAKQLKSVLANQSEAEDPVTAGLVKQLLGG
ncbi:MAG: glucose-6-phosphate isomerase [Pseudomonadota bacterium]